MSINPFEVAGRYGYSQEDFANDANFESHWSNRSEQDLIGGLQSRSDYGDRIGGLTQVSGPSALQGLNEQQIVRDPNSSNIYYANGYQPQGGNDLGSFVDEQTEEIEAANGTSNTISGGSPSSQQHNQAELERQMTPFEEAILRQNQAMAAQAEERRATQETQREGRINDLEGENEDMDDAMARYDERDQELTQKRDTLLGLRDEMKALYDSYFAADSAAKSNNVSSAFITADRRKLQDKFNSQVAWLNVERQMLNDDYTMASKAANDYFAHQVTTNQTQIANYTHLLDLNNSNIIHLDGQEERFVKEQTKVLESANTRIKEEKQTIQDLALNHPSVWNKAGVTMNMSLDEIALKMAEVAPEQNMVDSLMLSYPDAGIKPSDTIQSAQAKLKNSAKYNKEIRIVGNNGGDTSLLDSGFVDVLQDAINSGMTPEEAARAAAAISERMGIPVTQKQLT